MEHGETLNHICTYEIDGRLRLRGEFPAAAHVYYWSLPSHTAYAGDDYATRFAQARLAQQLCWIEQCIDIANTMYEGEEETLEQVSGMNPSIKLRRVRKDALAHRALMIETRMRVVKMLNPQKWAERLQAPDARPEDSDQAGVGETFKIEGGLPDDIP